MRLEQLLHATLRDVSGEKADLQIQSTTLVNGRLKVLDTGTWTERFDEYEQIRRDIAGDRLEVVGGVRVSPQVLLHTSEKDDELRDKALVVISRIKTIKQQQGISLRKAYLQLSHLYWARKETQETGVDTKEEESFPSRATVYRYFANEKKGLPVLIGHSTKGNRTPRYPQKLIDLIVEKAEKLYLVPKSKWTSPHFTNHLTQLAKDAGLLPAGKELNRRYVLQVIAQHACPDEDKARMDPRDVPAGKSIAKLTIRLAMPFQRVEQDALHLPFVVKTPMGISGAIYLVWAVDCYTSIILGWKLVIGAPRDSDSLACFGRTLFSKQEILAQMGIKTDIDLFGTPIQVIYDNGPENMGHRMKRLTRLGIKPMHCKSRHAHGKPFIERLNRSLKEAIEVLPGCTRFNGEDGMRDPIAEGDTLLDLEELERWIVRWMFEVWVHQPLERMRSAVFVDDFRGVTPAQVRKSITSDQCVLPLPPNRREWQLVQYEQDENCKLNRKTGLSTRSFHFAGRNLEGLINELGETSVTALVDPDDFRFAYIPLDDGARLVKLINRWTDDRTPAYSFERAKEIFNGVPKDNPGKEIQDAFWRDLYALATETSPSPRQTKRSTRQESKETTKRSKDHAAVQRAAKNPIQPASTESPGSATDPVGNVVWSDDPIGVFNVNSYKPGKGGLGT